MGFFFVITGLAAIGLGWWLHLRAQARGRKAEAWSTTKGTVLSSEVVKVPVGNNTMLMPAVAYSYDVGGEAWQGAALQVGAPPLFNTPSKAQALAARYPAGSQVTVHYDPAAPASAALSLKIGEGFGPLMAYSGGATFLAGGILILAMGL